MNTISDTRCSNETVKKKIKVGLVVDEFFGGAGTAIGGYGFLARKVIAKYIPDEIIQIEVLLREDHKVKDSVKKFVVDNTNLYVLPKDKSIAEKFLLEKNYDIYLSIELTHDFIMRTEKNESKRLILWIQDPRPRYIWNDIINTMYSVKEPNFYNQDVYDVVHEWANRRRVKFISQGYSLNPLAMQLYNCSVNTPIQYLPNPVDIDFDFQFKLATKKKQVIFLGRLETQKRVWLVCEVAKRMPAYEFFVVGKFFRYRSMNKKMIGRYMRGNITNLHFLGHLDGEEKTDLIKESRILLNTAIWEGIPISWLEALSYGTLIVSNLEREGLVERFGGKVQDLLGDGFDGVDTFVPVIRNLMENDELYGKKATAAIAYIREVHNIPRFVNDMRKIIIEESELGKRIG